ncbi:MAG: amidohydrolase family protein [Chloroflexi bacterium]|nr:amidohydrolase family protein [Chloroflexota bacterium]
MKFDTIVRNGRVVTSEQGEFLADVAISDGKIAALLQPGEAVEAGEAIDASGLVVMPGAIDPHLHLSLHKPPENDYYTEGAMAAVGGVTTIIPYLIAKEDYDGLYQSTLESASKGAVVDFGFHYYVGTDEHVSRAGHYIRDHGVSSLKFYMPARPGEDTIWGGLTVDDGLMFDLFTEVAKYEHAVANIHCENIEIVQRYRKRAMESGRSDLAAWSDTRPPFVEAEAIQRATFYANIAGCPLHVVHLSSGAGLNAIREAKARYPQAQITVETCPSYLVIDKFSPMGNLARVVPPVQSKEDNEAMWGGIADGSIDCMATDHSPGLREWKKGTVWQARNNFTDVGVMLPIILSEGHNKRGIPLRRVVELTATNTAKIFNLYPRKGTIRVGSDADLILVDLGWQRTVHQEELYSWADFSIYEGMEIKGWPRVSMVRGVVVQKDGKLVGPKGHGKYLARPVAKRAEAASR